MEMFNMVRILEDVICASCDSGLKAMFRLYIDGNKGFPVCIHCQKKFVKNGIRELGKVEFRRLYARD